jgi:hypothetical protein
MLSYAEILLCNLVFPHFEHQNRKPVGQLKGAVYLNSLHVLGLTAATTGHMPGIFQRTTNLWHHVAQLCMQINAK